MIKSFNVCILAIIFVFPLFASNLSREDQADIFREDFPENYFLILNKTVIDANFKGEAKAKAFQQIKLDSCRQCESGHVRNNPSVEYCSDDIKALKAYEERLDKEEPGSPFRRCVEIKQVVNRSKFKQFKTRQKLLNQRNEEEQNILEARLPKRYFRHLDDSIEKESRGIFQEDMERRGGAQIELHTFQQCNKAYVGNMPSVTYSAEDMKALKKYQKQVDTDPDSSLAQCYRFKVQVNKTDFEHYREQKKILMQHNKITE
jgi:hypothetical protein